MGEANSKDTRVGAYAASPSKTKKTCLNCHFGSRHLYFAHGETVPVDAEDDRSEPLWLVLWQVRDYTPLMRIIYPYSIVLVLASAVTGSELKRFDHCKLVPTEWADGDSFSVEFPDGTQHTVRLYGIDCLEMHVSDDSDARRLRAQRRYFGISKFGGSTKASVNKAKALAGDAADETRRQLQGEFTVYTAFADGRGDGKHKRIYAFVVTSRGRDLGDVLVAAGMARAFGVYRGRYDGIVQDEYKQHLADLELLAARQGKGIWNFTDWETLPEERRVQRQEDREMEDSRNSLPELTPASINPNTAARDELIRLPGIGETLANRIIEGRESSAYRMPQDLLRIDGIGDKTIDQLKPFLRFD